MRRCSDWLTDAKMKRLTEIVRKRIYQMHAEYFPTRKYLLGIIEIITIGNMDLIKWTQFHNYDYILNLKKVLIIAITQRNFSFVKWLIELKEFKGSFSDYDFLHVENTTVEIFNLLCQSGFLINKTICQYAIDMGNIDIINCIHLQTFENVLLRNIFSRSSIVVCGESANQLRTNAIKTNLYKCSLAKANLDIVKWFIQHNYIRYDRKNTMMPETDFETIKYAYEHGFKFNKTTGAALASIPNAKIEWFEWLQNQGYVLNSKIGMLQEILLFRYYTVYQCADRSAHQLLFFCLLL